MRTTAYSFRMKSSALSCLKSFAASRSISVSTLVRLIVLFGPMLTDDYLDGHVRHYCFYGKELRPLQIEIVRQRSNLKQSVDGLALFRKRNHLRDQDYPSDDPVMVLLDACDKQLERVLSFIDLLSSVRESVCLNTRKPISVDQANNARVYVRLYSDLSELLSLNAELFQVSRAGYIQLSVSFIEAIYDHAYRSLITDGDDFGGFTPACYVGYLDFVSICDDFRQCGKVFNEAAHYLNATLLGRPMISHDYHKMISQTFLGQLDVSVDYYNRFLDRHRFPELLEFINREHGFSL